MYLYIGNKKLTSFLVKVVSTIPWGTTVSSPRLLINKSKMSEKTIFSSKKGTVLISRSKNKATLPPSRITGTSDCVVMPFRLYL